MVKQDEEWTWDGVNAELFRFVGRHLSLIFGALPLVLFILRITFISRGDSSVLAGLMRNTDLTVLFVSTALLWLPAVLMMGTYLLIVSRGFKYVNLPIAEMTRFGLVASWWSLVAVYLMARPWRTAMIFSAAIAVFAALNWISLRRHRKAGASSFSFGIEPAVLLGALALTVYAGSPSWLAVERIEMETGQVRVGYVIDDEGPIQFLDHKGGLQYLEPSEVRSRQPCTIGGDDERTILMVIARSDRQITQACPTS